jgi:hypothetical protein
MGRRQHPTLIATSVVRGANQGQSHGGIFLIDMASQQIRQTVDWNTADIDFQGRGWDRGLRGIAFYRDSIYIAASDELFVYDQEFKIRRSFRNSFLKHCHEIACHGDLLYLTSTGFDSILTFDLEREEFSHGIQFELNRSTVRNVVYDPNGSNGPAAANLLHLNNVHVNEGGTYVSGMKTGCMLRIDDNNEASRVVKLPRGIHNAQPFRDGVLFNDTASDRVRFIDGDGGDVRFRVPAYKSSELTHTGSGDRELARQGFARGLCLVSDSVIAAGSSPSTVSLYDLDDRTELDRVNLSMDIRNAIHGLEVWPFG